MWKTVKLGDVCEFQSGLWKGKKEPYVNAYVIRNTNFTKSGELSFDNVAELEVEKKQLSKRTLEFGDIVLEKSGGGDKTPVGRVCVFEKLSGDKPYSLSNFTSLIRVKDKATLDYRYLHRVLYFIYISGKTEAMQRHSTGIRNLQLTQYKDVLFSLPPLAEQQRIVATLDAVFVEIDKAIAAAESQATNAHAVFERVLAQAFELQTQDWCCEKLKALTSKIGSGATPKGGKLFYKEDGLSLIRSLNVYDMRFEYKGLAKIDEAQAAKLANVNVEEDDVLLNITGASVARCCIVTNDVLPARVNQHVSIIRANKDRLKPKFLAYGLVSKPHKEKFLSVGESGGATRQAITKSDIEEYEFCFPSSLGEQNRAVEKLDALHETTQELSQISKKKIGNLVVLKSAILAAELQRKAA